MPCPPQECLAASALPGAWLWVTMCGYLNPQMAFVEHLDGSFLFDSMYSEDVEGNKLSYLPGVGELLETYPFWVTAASSGAGLVQVPPACLGQVHLTLYLIFPIIHVRPWSLNLCCMQKAIPATPVEFCGVVPSRFLQAHCVTAAGRVCHAREAEFSEAGVGSVLCQGSPLATLLLLSYIPLSTSPGDCR